MSARNNDAAPESLAERFSTAEYADAAESLTLTRTRLSEAREAIGADSPEVELLDRLERLIDLMETAWVTLDPALATASYFTGFKSSLDPLCTQLAQPALNAPALTQATDKLANLVRTSAGPMNSAESAALLNLEHRLKRLHVASRTQKQSLHGFAEALEVRVDQLTEDGGSALRRSEDATAQFRRVVAGLLLSERRKAVEQRAVQLTEAEQLLGQLREVLAIAADESLSANYGNRADDEQKSADRFRTYAALAGVLAVAVSIAVVVLQMLYAAKGWDYSQVQQWPPKIAVIASLGGLSAYFARQSAMHRTYGVYLRDAQLELSNLGPYLAELTPDVRAEVRRSLVNTYFGRKAPMGGNEVDGPSALAAASKLLGQDGGPVA